MLKKWLSQCSNLLEPVRRAETREEREAIYRFRYQVYYEEFGRELGTPDHDRKWVRDDDDEKQTTTILYTGTREKITGTVRLRHWRAGEVPEGDFKELSMDRFLDIDQRNVAEIERLMVRPSNRGKLVLASLVRASYDILVRERETDLCFCYCSPGLVRYYQHLAMRPFGGRLVNAPDGMMIPLVAVMSDYGYYRRTGSFLAPMVRRYFGPGKRPRLDITPYLPLFEDGATGLEFDQERVWNQVEDRLLGARTKSILSSIPKILARELVSQGLIIDVTPGVLVTREGFCERELYMVMEGDFVARGQASPTRLIGEGELFGEDEFFSDDGRRTSSVEVLSPGRLLILRGRSIEKLVRRNSELADALLPRLRHLAFDHLEKAA